MTRPPHGQAGGPADPIDLPGDIHLPPIGPVPAGDDLVAGLADDVPLLLLPVRIVTRFDRSGAPGSKPSHLRIRIFPDVLHADGHEAALSPDELAAGRAYWRRLWLAGGDPAARSQAHQWLFSIVEPARAVHVIERTTPTNSDQAPTRPVPAGRPLPVEPSFDDTVAVGRMWPVRPRLLPERWSVTVLSNNEIQGTWWSEPVSAHLVQAPSLAGLPVGATAEDLLTADDIAWMRDFDAARQAGMALRIPLNAETRRNPIDLVVAGVRRGAGHAQGFADLLEAHRLSNGLEIVRPGTPTNTTETAASGYSTRPADPEAFLTAQLWSMPDDRRPTLADPTALTRAAAADALAVAFGIEGPTAFDRAAEAGDIAIRWAGAMNRTMWPATVGHTLSTVLTGSGTPLLPGRDLDFARDWFCDWVRAGGPLPAFRVGPQPYGVLPVTPRPNRAGPARTQVHALEDVLDGLWDSWAATTPPALSPVAGEAGTPEEQAVLVGSVLGAVPHPTAFRLRDAPVRFAGLEADWTAALDDLEAILQRTSSNAVQEFHDREQRLRGSGGIVDQQAVVSQLITLYADWQSDDPTSGTVDYQPALDHLRQTMRPLLAAHDFRSVVRRHSTRFSPAALADPADPPLWYVVYGEDSTRPDGTFPQLQLSPAAPEHDPLQTAANLRDLAAQARSVTEPSRPAVDHSSPNSLLRTLIDQGIATVHHTKAGELAAGLDELADMLENGGLHDPFGELRRLLRETLGLATHRYDAWLTSMATRRLARRRSASAGGLQIGCYGWVVGLRADEGGPDTSGFIHAPSLDHAATAAILRSSWLAYSDTAADAAYAVDLSSDRLRRATWLLDGVRNGQDLAELLGGRFERRLHDSGLDDLIDDIRHAVLTAAPADGIPGTVVDGLALAVAYTDTAVAAGTDPVLLAVEAVRTGLPAHRADRLAGILREGVVDLDAVADALLAQSVHALVKGNLASAASSLSASGSGDSGIPELSMASPHRDAQVITHRIVAVLPAFQASDPVTARLSEIAEPSATAWLRALLAGVGAQPVRVQLLDHRRAPLGTVDVTLGELGLDAVDVLTLTPPDGGVAGSRLARVICGMAMSIGSRRPAAGAPAAARLDETFAAAGGSSIADVAVALAALRSALSRARPLRAADLTPDDAVVTEPDVADLETRRRTLATRLAELAAEVGTDRLLADRLSDLIAVDPDGVIAALHSPDSASCAAAIAAVLTAAGQAATALTAADPEGWQGWPAQARADHLGARMAAALATPLPALPRFTPGNAEELSASLHRSTLRIDSAVGTAAWLVEVGRLHDGAAALSEATLLTEAVGIARWDEPGLAQLPDIEREPWLATHRPLADGSRLCLLTTTQAGPALRAGAVAGLLFDGWTEAIPHPTVTTGVAVHLDSPGARPPQAVLLATLDADDRWTSAGLVQLLRQTLQLAQFRATGPGSLLGWGHTLPGIFLPADARVAVDGAAEADQ